MDHDTIKLKVQLAVYEVNVPLSGCIKVYSNSCLEVRSANDKTCPVLHRLTFVLTLWYRGQVALFLIDLEDIMHGVLLT